MGTKEILERVMADNLELRLSNMLRSHGHATDLARPLFRFISNIFTYVPPELISWKFKVVLAADGYHVENKDVIHIDNFKDIFRGECTVVMLTDNTFVIDTFNASFLGQAYISYIYYAPLNEQLYVDEEVFQLPDYYGSTTSSIFAYPIYKELDEALIIYHKTLAENSVCGILNQVWKDETRKEFCEKPEHFMRDSLWQYLRAVLRNHTVKREQVVDDSHPVDIKITWPIISNVALIEVKWLGDSGATKYRDARANEGAKQLIDYLVSSYTEEPDKNFLGYLAVFDGRRGKAALNQYGKADINYEQAYIAHPKMKFQRFFLSECS